MLIGWEILTLVERLCPAKLMISGMCMAGWYPSAVTATFSFTAALSAALVILSAVAVAPAAKRWVAYAALVIGSVAALLFAIQAEVWTEFTCAIVAGVATFFFIRLDFERAAP